MTTLDEEGFDVIKHPIKRVRVQFHAGLWYVEYQRPAKFYVDGWWWFDDSKHAEYKDAFARAQELSVEGGIKELRHKTLTFEVNV